MKITKKRLMDYYIKQKKSVGEIAKIFHKSETGINYWMKKYEIPKRSVSEAIYIKHNPNGDPFLVKTPRTVDDAILYGLGLGLYWGEGTKSNKCAIRLGNTDPELIKKFLEFLKKVYTIDSNKLRFGLQIFSDMSPKDVLDFWKKELNISSNQFQKVIVTPSRGIGTYKNKVKYGVLTIHYNNKKLRDILCAAIENLQIIR